MRILHFDVGKSQRKCTIQEGHEYIDMDVNQYIDSYGPFEADIVTSFPTSNFNSEVIDSIKNLKLIITRSIGVDNIDGEYCEKKGIKYLNVEYSRYNIVHHTLALILFFTRQLNESFNQTQKGKFCHEEIDCLDLRIRTLGIIGYGRIGREVAELADAFRMRVIACDRKYEDGEIVDGFEMYELENLLKESDIISLHCDANPSNIGLINEKNIGIMKDGVALINTARGSIINEKDLIKNIEKFSFVGLDVLQNETKFDSNHLLIGYPNIYITPHTAYKSEVTTQERWNKTYQYINDFIC